MNTQYLTDLAPYLQCEEGLLDLYARLGRVVLVPIPPACERGNNASNGPPAITYAESQTASHLRKLSGADVAVQCGSESGNLCAIVFQEIPILKQFLEGNPRLTSTAILHGPFGACLFVRIKEGFYPPPDALPGLTWFGEGGFVPVLQLDNQAGNLKWTNNYRPLEISFEEIVWPPDVQRIFTLHALQHKFGKPLKRERKGKIILNAHFWAGAFVSEYKVCFLPEGEFQEFDPQTHLWRTLPEEELQARLVAFVRKWSSYPGWECLAWPCSRQQLKDLVAAMRAVAVTTAPAAVDTLKKFISECLENHPGGSVSVQEFYAAWISKESDDQGNVRRFLEKIQNGEFCDDEISAIVVKKAISSP